MEPEHSLWDSTPPATDIFDPEQIAHLPAAAQRYLTHALAPGTPLASAVRLTMTGEIKLKGWLPFTATQVIRWDQGFVWRAKVKMGIASISGFDRLIGGQGAMRWKLFGLIPIVTADGPDITRSAAGRVATEAIWLPSVLCRSEVEWADSGPNEAIATVQVGNIEVPIHLRIADNGRVESVRIQRWGNPAGHEFMEQSFGGFADQEATFAGVTVPSVLRVGWHPNTPEFAEGEFFRCTVTSAEYR